MRKRESRQSNPGGRGKEEDPKQRDDPVMRSPKLHRRGYRKDGSAKSDRQGKSIAGGNRGRGDRESTKAKWEEKLVGEPSSEKVETV